MQKSSLETCCGPIFIFDIYFLFELKMGNICCQIDAEKSFIDDDILKRDHYQQTNLPTNDQVLNDWLTSSHIKIDSQGPVKAMKDIEKDRYYYGQWKDGVPEGKGLFYEPSKLLFNGVFENGVPTGPAKIKFIDSHSEFEGELKEGRANGVGKIDNIKQRYKFEGEWENSKPKKGTLTFVMDPNISNVKFEDFSQRKAVINYKDTRKYEGEINTSKLVPDGRGIVHFPLNGTKLSYDGEWHNGQMHGKGKFQWTDGSSYDGQFIHGRKEGEGTFLFSNGNRYEGYWVGGRQQGVGTLFNKDNQVLKKGTWKNGGFEATILSSADWQRQSQASAIKRQKILEEVTSQIKQEKKKQQQSASKIVKHEAKHEESAVNSKLKQIKEDPVAQNHIVGSSIEKNEHQHENHHDHKHDHQHENQHDHHHENQHDHQHVQAQSGIKKVEAEH